MAGPERDDPSALPAASSALPHGGSTSRDQLSMGLSLTHHKVSLYFIFIELVIRLVRMTCWFIPTYEYMTVKLAERETSADFF